MVAFSLMNIYYEITELRMMEHRYADRLGGRGRVQTRTKPCVVLFLLA
jgi:hypothetical protein